jgi:hypothetical protein
MYINANAPLPA